MKYCTVLPFLLLSLPAFLPYSASGQSWFIPITISDNATGRTIDTIGYDINATYCLDPVLGEVRLPALQAGDFGSRLIDPCGDSLRLDLYPWRLYFLDTFRIKFQGGSGSSVIRFSWPSGLGGWPVISLRMIDVFGGVFVNWDMLTKTSDSITNPGIDELRIILALDGDLGVPYLKNSVPHTFALSQNYPNPFNPSTTIRYELPGTIRVMLKVYDMAGREVAVLVDGIQSPGYRSARFVAKDLPSGIYFCRLSAGVFTDVKKMLLLR